MEPRPISQAAVTRCRKPSLLQNADKDLTNFALWGGMIGSDPERKVLVRRTSRPLQHEGMRGTGVFTAGGESARFRFIGTSGL